MSDRSSLPPRMDPFALAAREDPYRVYAALRAAGPVLRGGPGIWVIPRHQEVCQLLRHPLAAQFHFDGATGPAPGPSGNETPVGQHGGGSAAMDLLKGVVVTSNGEAHGRVRRALGQAFTADRWRGLDALIAGEVDQLLSTPRARGRLEAMAELAFPLPTSIIGHLLGVPAVDRCTVGRLVLTLSRLFAPVVAPADRDAADAAVTSLREYFGALFDERRARPADDMVSSLVASCAAEVMSRRECVDNCIFLAFAGLETSMTMIGAGCAALSRHPQQFARLQADPALAPRAVNEFLRFDAPTQITARIAVEPFDVAGQTIARGRIMLLVLGSANRDERTFHAPEALDVGRDPNPHVAFGGGAHYCVGAGLARREGEAVFRALARLRSIAPAGDVVREPSVTPRIYSSVPLEIA